MSTFATVMLISPSQFVIFVAKDVGDLALFAVTCISILLLEYLCARLLVVMSGRRVLVNLLRMSVKPILYKNKLDLVDMKDFLEDPSITLQSIPGRLTKKL